MRGARPRAALLAGIGACIAGIFAACPAKADAPPLSIAWDAPAGCPDADAVRAALQRWVQLTPERAAHAGVTATAAVKRVDGGWELDLTLVSPGGKQEESLVTERCETFVELVALKVALAADPEGLVRGLDAARKPAPAADPPWALRGAFGLGVGLLPGAAASVAVLAGYEGESWRVEAGGELWFPRAATYDAPPNVGADISLYAGEARACALPALGGVTFPVCGGAVVGAMAGEGFNVSDVKTSRQLWAALAFGPAIRWRVAGPVFFWLEGEVLFSLARPAYHVRNLPQLYEANTASARGWAGLEVRFGE
ncbi:MAG TPA: hypothetical protein VHV30_10015 [Polyangiaceae bacterium]|jgi:hypothetical protein|nr:hypothetical protein [Polyangiaceae bacterium]